jgi:thiol-disulfide isomerase/thioredoxin
MKYPLFIFLIVVSPVFALGQSRTVEIFGTITGDYDNKMYFFFDKNYRHRDSAEIKDGKFYFKSSAALPALARFHMDGQSLLQDVYIDGPKIYLACTNKIVLMKNGKDTMNYFQITDVKGSEMNIAKQRLEEQLDKIKNAERPEIEKNQAYYDTLYAFINKNPKSKVGAYFVGKSNNLNYHRVATLSGLLDSALLDVHSFEGFYIVRLLNALDKSKHPAVGKPLSLNDVTLKDTSGVIWPPGEMNGKYVLVDIWASWCKPCRAANPGLKKLSEKFRNKNFALLSISVDQHLSKWKEAIIQDGLQWKQVIDQSNVIYERYSPTGIPQTILIDKEGKIIGVGLTAGEIDKILSKVL